MICIVSADDLGLTPGITRGIFEAADAGALTSTSVIANGSDFEAAMRGYKERSNLELSVHINLMEGLCLSPRSQVSLLVDDDGRFCRSFPSLLAMSSRLSGARRSLLDRQIETELNAQISRVAAAMGNDWRPRIDSHQHYHMIPAVFEALMRLDDKYHFGYMRALSEPFFSAFSAPNARKSYLGANLIKHSLLKTLSHSCRRRLKERAIPHCRWFVGLLFSGHMSQEVIEAAVSHLRTRCDRNTIVEFLLHPGRALENEQSYWDSRPDLAAYYRSACRDDEKTTLTNPDFNIVIDPYRGPVPQRPTEAMSEQSQLAT